jgi:hypothetical protein
MILNLLVAGSMAGLTWLLGWWGVAVAALILGFVFRHEDGRAWWVALGASEGWAILLVIDMVAGPLGRVESTLGGAMRIPGPALLLLTLLFPALLGWSGAAVASEIGRRVSRRKDEVKPLHA